MDGIPGAVEADFEQVVRLRETRVLRTAYRMLGNWADAEDVAQEAFLRLYRRGLGFQNDAVLGAWLYRVTVNLCLDRVRSRRPTEELTEQACQEASPEARLREKRGSGG